MCSQLSERPGLGVMVPVHGPVCVQLTAGGLAGVTALGLSGSDSRAWGLLAVGQALPGCEGGLVLLVFSPFHVATIPVSMTLFLFIFS